jgi:hypothetical protein
MSARQKERLREARTAASRPAQPMLSAGPPKRAPAVLSAKYGVRGSKAEGFYLYKDSTKPPRLKDGTLPPPIDGRPAAPSMGERLTAIVEFLQKEDAAQKARRKAHNDVINQRKRQLRLAEGASAGS